MPFNPGNVRKVNALGGKRPQATGIVLIPKNNGNVLKTSNGSTANYGGNTKFGLYPNVGMSYLFQNKIGVGSLFYNTTTPSQVNPPVAASGGFPVPPPVSGESVSISYWSSDNYRKSLLQPDGTIVVDYTEASTSSWNDFFDGNTSNRELFINVDNNNGGTNVDNADTIQSNIPVEFKWYGFDDQNSPTGKLYISIIDDANATYSIEVATSASTNTYTSTLEGITPAEANQYGLHQPPVGTAAVHELQLSAGEAGSGADIIVEEGSGGRNPVTNNLRLGVNFPNFPLVITVTKN